MIEDGDIDDKDVIDSFGCSVFLLGFVEAFSSHGFRNSSTLFFFVSSFFLEYLQLEMIESFDLK